MARERERERERAFHHVRGVCEKWNHNKYTTRERTSCGCVALSDMCGERGGAEDTDTSSIANGL